jgi:DegV family protein with EDD domain
MDNFIIVTDNTADLYEGYYEQNPTKRLCYPYTIEGKEYVGDDEYPISDFYQALKEGKLVKTSQINPATAAEVFEEVLKEGHDLLYISFSSGLTGSFENLTYVINGLRIKYPQRRAEIVDTLSGAGGEGLIVYKAKQMQAEGKSMDEIIKWIEDNRLYTHHVFTVNDIVNLKHSGRISTLQALFGILANIKPVFELSHRGKISVLTKAMGRKRSIQEVVRYFKQYYLPEKNDFLLVGHTGRLDEAEYLAEKLKEVEPVKPVKYCLINKLVSGSAGYNSLVVFFFGKLRITH